MPTSLTPRLLTTLTLLPCLTTPSHTSPSSSRPPPLPIVSTMTFVSFFMIFITPLVFFRGALALVFFSLEIEDDLLLISFLLCFRFPITLSTCLYLYMPQSARSAMKPLLHSYVSPYNLYVDLLRLAQVQPRC
ncbi:hypothetical protein DL93DRAFT_1065397 [Clavulina sp. PMI_390]|nr:hypothetical protein DL93DRAFT_1065397 [Clavulina sp. PMI_390]